MRSAASLTLKGISTIVGWKPVAPNTRFKTGDRVTPTFHTTAGSITATGPPWARGAEIEGV